MMDTAIANYHLQDSKGLKLRKSMYRKLDKDQTAQGCIKNQVPANRDGAILTLVEEAQGEEVLPTGRK